MPGAYVRRSSTALGRVPAKRPCRTVVPNEARPEEFDGPVAVRVQARAMRVVFLALTFIAELAAWSALGVAAYLLAGGGWHGWVAAIITIVVVITAWGLLASPKAKAPAVVGLVTKIVVFGGSVVALALTGHPFWAAALGLLIVVSHVGVGATTPRAPLPAQETPRPDSS